MKLSTNYQRCFRRIYWWSKRAIFAVLHDESGVGLEKKVNRICKTTPVYGKVLRNVYLPMGANGDETEIDVIYISESGIYSFECKNYSGLVRKCRGKDTWKETFSSGKSFEFYNPVKQNQTHVWAIHQTLRKYGYDYQVYNIVVFGMRANIAHVRRIRKGDSVCCTFDIRSILYSIYHNTDLNVRLSHDDIDEIYRCLKPYSEVSPAQKRRHIQMVEQRKSAPKGAA